MKPRQYCSTLSTGVFTCVVLVLGTAICGRSRPAQACPVVDDPDIWTQTGVADVCINRQDYAPGATVTATVKLYDEYWCGGILVVGCTGALPDAKVNGEAVTAGSVQDFDDYEWVWDGSEFQVVSLRWVYIPNIHERGDPTTVEFKLDPEFRGVLKYGRVYPDNPDQWFGPHVTLSQFYGQWYELAGFEVTVPAQPTPTPTPEPTPTAEPTPTVSPNEPTPTPADHPDNGTGGSMCGLVGIVIAVILLWFPLLLMRRRDD